MKKCCHINDIEEHNIDKKKMLNRLNRIEGQVNGIKKMVESDIYCDDILNQISSIKSALNGLSKVLLERHLKNCVIDKIKNNDDEIIQELLSTIHKMLK